MLNYITTAYSLKKEDCSPVEKLLFIWLCNNSKIFIEPEKNELVADFCCCTVDEMTSAFSQLLDKGHIQWLDENIKFSLLPFSVQNFCFEMSVKPICVQCDSTDDLTIDHIKPTSKGGDDTNQNKQILCRSCNSQKGNEYDEQ